MIGHGKSHIRVDGVRYVLQQYHFHAPSEHTINGVHSPMEVHIVHRDEELGDLAVLAILIEEGSHNEVLDEVWDRIPSTPGQRIVLETAFASADRLLPRSRRYYRYRGSLTTPPCAEDVTWLVLQDPILMSAQQLDRYRTLYNGTNRPIQPLYDRQILQGQ